jgi:hypothetical protein
MLCPLQLSRENKLSINLLLMYSSDGYLPYKVSMAYIVSQDPPASYTVIYPTLVIQGWQCEQRFKLCYPLRLGKLQS